MVNQETWSGWGIHCAEYEKWRWYLVLKCNEERSLERSNRREEDNIKMGFQERVWSNVNLIALIQYDGQRRAQFSWKFGFSNILLGSLY